MTEQKCVFSFEQETNVLVVTPNGTFTEYRDNDIRNAYNDTYRMLDNPEVNHLLFDFSNLTFFGSTLVGILIQLAKKVRLGGGEAVLCNLSDDMQSVMKSLMLLENTRTNFFWTCYPTRPQALAELAKATDNNANNN
ncbi:MAG: anti-sigma factor antagonist [Planctomycetaceae bacterium]|nr:anti-sigma factor antagonist [Planctomycetaceae bacterium]